MEPISPPGKAPATQYAPSTPTDWSPPPKNVAEALDQLAEVQNTPVPAGEVPYSPAVPGDWSPSPTEVAQALDQLAAQAQGEVTAVTASAPLASSGGPTPNITISPATDAAPGSMSAADKTKLDNLAATTVPYTPTTPGDWSPAPSQVGAALDQLAARPQGGGGTSNVFVWRQNAVSPVAPVYGTLQGAYDAAIATGIPCVIFVDSSLAPSNTSYSGTGSFDFSNITLQGSVPGGGATMVFGDNIGNTAVVSHLRHVKDLVIYNNGTGTPITITSGDESWIFENVSLANQVATPFILIDGTGGEANLSFIGYAGTSIGGTSCIRLINSGSFNASLYETSSITSDALSDDGTGSVDVGIDLSSRFDRSQAGFSGQLQFDQLDILPTGVFVWRNNRRAPYVYPTFNDALVAAQNYNRPATVLCDGGGTINAGSYDTTNITVRGYAPNQADTIFLNEGVLFNNDTDLVFENISINTNMSATPAWTPNSRQLFLKDVSLYGQGTAPFCSGANGGAVIFAKDTTFGGNAGNEPLATDGHALEIHLSGSSTLNDNTIRGADLFYLVTNAESAITLPQTGFTGTVTLVRSDKANLVDFTPGTPGNWPIPAPATVQDAIDTIAANTITKYHPIVPGNVKTLTSGVPTNLLQIDITQTINPPYVDPDYSFACKLFFACECTDGNAVQIRQGDCNAAVAYNHNTTTFATSQAVNATAAITDGGTLTVVFSWATSGTIATLQVTATSSLSPTEFDFHYFSNHATHPFTYL